MAVCKKCHKAIPDGKDFCEECEMDNKLQADESYLEGLLNSVISAEEKDEDDTAVKKVQRASKREQKEALPENVEAAAADDSDMDELLDSLFGDKDGSEADDDMIPAGDELLPDDISAIFDEIESVPDTPAADEMVVEEAPSDEMVAEEAAADEMVAEEAAADEMVAEEASSDEVMVDETVADEILSDILSDDMMSDDIVADSPVASNVVMADDDFMAMMDEAVAGDMAGVFDEIHPSEATEFRPADELLNSEPEVDVADGDVDIDALMDSIQSGEFAKELAQLSDEKKTKASKKKKEKKVRNRGEKKENLFKRLFFNIKEEHTPEELEEIRQKMIEEEENKKKEAEDKKKREAESKEEKKARLEKEKAEKAEAAAKAKEQKAAEKKAKAEAAALKAKEKKEAKLAVEEIDIDPGRINKAGASILVVIFAALAAFIVIGTNIYSYNLSIQNAQQDFDRQRYNDAYYDVYGLNIRDEDIVLYDRIMTVMYVNKQLNSYNNYMVLDEYDKALDSLLKGLQRYDKYIQLAEILEIVDDMDYVRNQILDELYTQFSITEAEAQRLIVLEEVFDYSEFVYDTTDAFENN